ncbi:uncharacterized protein VTP21DRAFT_7885 [Calcarisporiella thermophila]|uniref:uncharacterized protein n=1 Tax=Calcarisporiella thermophila TaxID=911321 RepID=UPI003743387F
MFCHTPSTSASSFPTTPLPPGWRACPGILHSTGKALPAKWLSGTKNADAPILARGCIHGKGMGKERVITNSTFPGHDPKCTRCNAPRDTIRHTFFECPELTSVWHWTERCINTISGPLNTQVLSPRNLVLGDLPEAPRAVRHAAQIVFDSVLWQIHRDRIAYHFECTRASPETIILRAKMDIEEAIGGELIKARKRREIELFRRRWCGQGAVIESSDRARLKLE